MDDLRWILATIGLVLVAAVYLSGRSERDEWRRDRKKISDILKTKNKPEKVVVNKERTEPQINLQEEIQKTSREEIWGEQDKVVDSREAISGKSVKSGRAEPSFNIDEEFKDEKDVKETPEISTQPITQQPVEEAKERPEQKTEQKEAAKSKEKQREAVEESPVAYSKATYSKAAPIEDEIIDIEIPEDIDELEKELEEGIDPQLNSDRQSKSAKKEEPLQQELLLEIEPLVIALTIMARGDEILSGNDIKRALDGSGLKCDDRGIFEFHMTGKKDSVFSIVSAIEPGVFDLNTIDEYETPGLVCICQLPGPLPGKDMFRIMQMKALNIAEKLGAKLCDDKRNMLTEQATTHYNDRITEFEREVFLAKKKQR